MTMYRNNEGSIILSEMVNGFYFDRVYQGYTRREAIRRFKKELKENYTKITVGNRTVTSSY